MEIITDFLSTLQEKIDIIIDYACLLGILVVGFLFLSSMLRLLFGKKAQIGKAITSAMEILCLYIICIVIFTFELDVNLFKNPLPFISMEGTTLHIFPIFSADHLRICTQVLKLLMIAFLVNLMNSVIPEGKKLWFWLLMRVITVILALGANELLEMILAIWLPQGIAQYAPLALLAVLAVLILTGSLKLIAGVALGISNPIIGALYTFFFSNFIGRALARSILTTVLITALVVLMNDMELVSISIAVSSLIGLIPFLLVAILLWYIVDRIV